MNEKLFILVTLFCLFISRKGFAQFLVGTDTLGYVVIDNIEVEGNAKTKASRLIRELDFAIGDTIATQELRGRLESNTIWLSKTDVVSSVAFKVLKQTGHNIILVLEIEEMWFIYPIPIFELADRNLNTWIEDHNASLKRTNIGLRVKDINFSGLIDDAEVTVQTGYTDLIEMKYQLPYLLRRGAFGFGASVSYKQSREAEVGTVDNKQVFFSSNNEVLQKGVSANLSLPWRPNSRQSIKSSINWEQFRFLEDSVEIANPKYLAGGLREEILTITVRAENDQRSASRYPMGGHVEGLKIRLQTGITQPGPESADISGKLGYYLPFGKVDDVGLPTWSWWNELFGRTYLYINNLPQRHNEALGYGELTVYGYQLYVLDGQNYILGRTAIKRQLLNGKTKPKLFAWLLDSPPAIPIQLYISGHGGVGYIQDNYFAEENKLSNEWQFGGGIGLDIVFFYDKAFQFEYNVNKFGEGGIIFRNRILF